MFFARNCPCRKRTLGEPTSWTTGREPPAEQGEEDLKPEDYRREETLANCPGIPGVTWGVFPV